MTAIQDPIRGGLRVWVRWPPRRRPGSSARAKGRPAREDGHHFFRLLVETERSLTENPPPDLAFAGSARYVVYFDGPTGPLSVALDVSHPVLVCL